VYTPSYSIAVLLPEYNYGLSPLPPDVEEYYRNLVDKVLRQRAGEDNSLVTTLLAARLSGGDR